MLSALMSSCLAVLSFTHTHTHVNEMQPRLLPVVSHMLLAHLQPSSGVDHSPALTFQKLEHSRDLELSTVYTTPASRRCAWILFSNPLASNDAKRSGEVCTSWSTFKSSQEEFLPLKNGSKSRFVSQTRVPLIPVIQR